MEAYIILGILGLILVSFVIVALTWGRQIKVAKNCRIIKENYSWCAANVYIDKSIPYNNGFYLSGPDKIFVNEKQLVFACAATMKTVNFYVNKHHLFGVKGNLKKCSFVFLSDKSYDERTSTYKTKSNGISLFVKSNLPGLGGEEVCYMREKFMPQIVENGQLAVHEFLHALLRSTTGDGDSKHESNLIALENGKTIETLCNDAVKIIMTNKFSSKK